MKCADCGKEIGGAAPVMLGEHAFCNNLCRVIWAKRNPGSASGQVEAAHGRVSPYRVSSGGELEERSPVVRIVFGLIWFVVLYMLTLMVVGGVVGTVAASQAAEPGTDIAEAAAKSAVQRYGLLILIGNAVLVLLATMAGILPGTRAHKRKRGGRHARGPWGPVASVFWSLVVYGASLVPIAVTSMVAAHALMGENEKLTVDQVSDMMQDNGLLLAIGALTACLVAVPLTVLLAWVRRGPRVSEYLAFSHVSVTETVKWLLIILGVVIAFDLIAVFLKSDIVPDVMVRQYRTARYLPLFFVAIVVAAPLYEELIFRGFAFRGLLESRAGAIGAVMITALIWALLHIQYDIGRIASIFVFGVVIGLARLKTKSIYPPLLMHLLVNLVAFIELAVIAGKGG